jgi:PAS domain S-box-containing protein
MIDSLRAAFGNLISVFKGNGHNRSGQDQGTFSLNDAREIEGVVETFRQLVSRLSRDGIEIGQLCVRAEKRAAHYALLSETVVESVTSGIIVIEDSGEVSLINSAAKRILGLGDGEDLTGRRLGDLLRDGDELERLVAEAIREGTNSSRNLLDIGTLDGRRKRIGASVSCLISSPSRVDAVVVIFAKLDGGAAEAPGRPDELSQSERQSYLRGVLDAYDLVSTVMIEADRIRSHATEGAVSNADLSAFSRAAKRASDLMMAFALSKGARDAVTELVDLNCVVESVLRRNNFETGPNLVKHLHASMPRVKTIGKVLETGLEMLIAGCLGAGREGIEIVTGQWREAGKDLAGIVIRERSRSRPVLEVRDSLREFIGTEDMRREAGLILLRSLPSDTHRVGVIKRGDHLNFSIGILVPMGKGARPGAQTGEVTDRNQDEH